MIGLYQASDKLSSAHTKRLFWGGPQAVIADVLGPVVNTFDLQGRSAEFVGTSAAGPWAAAGASEAHNWDIRVSGLGLGDSSGQRNVFLPWGMIQYGWEKKFHKDRHDEGPAAPEDLEELTKIWSPSEVDPEMDLAVLRHPSKPFTLDAIYVALLTQQAVDIRRVVPIKETLTTPGRHRRAARIAIAGMVAEQNAEGKNHTHTVIEIPGGHGAASSLEAYRTLVVPRS